MATGAQHLSVGLHADLERRFGGLRRLYGDDGYARRLCRSCADASKAIRCRIVGRRCRRPDIGAEMLAPALANWLWRCKLLTLLTFSGIISAGLPKGP